MKNKKNEIKEPMFRVDLKGVGQSNCIGFYSKIKRESDDALELAVEIVNEMSKSWWENDAQGRYEIGLACISSCNFDKDLSKENLEKIKKDFKKIKTHMISRWKKLK